MLKWSSLEIRGKILHACQHSAGLVKVIIRGVIGDGSDSLVVNNGKCVIAYLCNNFMLTLLGCALYKRLCILVD